MKIASAKELEWDIATAAARQIVKVCDDMGFTAPEDLQVHVERVDLICVHLDSIVAALKIQKPKTPDEKLERAELAFKNVCEAARLAEIRANVAIAERDETIRKLLAELAQHYPVSITARAMAAGHVTFKDLTAIIDEVGNRGAEIGLAALPERLQAMQTPPSVVRTEIRQMLHDIRNRAWFGQVDGVIKFMRDRIDRILGKPQAGEYGYVPEREPTDG